MAWGRSGYRPRGATFSKFGNVKTEVDGIKFDSKAEADYYCGLKMIKRVGEISEIELQPTFTLQEKFVTNSGKKIGALKYKADFKVFYSDGRIEIVDVKGMETAVYKLKRKLFLSAFPELSFVEIKDGVRVVW